MKQLVCESLQEFFKIDENVETAKQLFAQKDISSNDALYKEFFQLLSEVPEKDIDKYAEWVVNAGIDPDYIKTELDKLETNKLTLDKEANAFASFRDFRSYIKEKINKKEQEKTLEEPKEDKNVRQEITQKEPEKIIPEEIPVKSPPESEKTIDKIKQKPTATQLRLMPYRLWMYGVLLKTRNHTYLKFGETRQEHEEGTELYAAGHTIGKFRGLVKGLPKDAINAAEDIKILFIVEVTDFAESINKGYIHPFIGANGKQTLLTHFDDYMRKRMSVSKHHEFQVGVGGESREVHEENKNQSDEEIRKKWLDDIYQLMHKPAPKPTKIYEARPFHIQMRDKILKNKDDNTFDKFLLAAATGAGKEVTTLEQIIHIHDILKKRKDPKTGKPLINKKTVHMSCATIPSTELELIEELSKVAGMNINSRVHTPFSRIKGYCTTRYKKGYYDQLSENAQDWFERNITPVEKIIDIPENESFDDVNSDVPVIFGSFHDLGMKANMGDPDGRYEDLRKRIGILSVGEGHQFLGNATNKMWPAIKKKYNFKFLLIITGTPYDFIFNETNHLYFSPEETSMFTRTDLYEKKRNYLKGLETGEADPRDAIYADYPDIYYYQVDIGDVVEKMKNDVNEPWEGDESSFTYQKLFEYDKTSKKFKYEDAIIFFFKRLLGFNTKGVPDKLSIQNAPGLCDYAKRHIIVALPRGGAGVDIYIPALVDLLDKNGALGKYKNNAFISKQDDLGDVKEAIENDTSPSVVFTCNALLTGTNVPAWGSIIFLRPIGNSIKFFEQATGRVGRAFKKKDKDTGEITENKTNVGVFLGDINNAINIHVSVEEKITSERNPKEKYSYVKQRIYDNYFFFGVNNAGEWKKFEMAQLNRALEEVSGEVDYRYSLCLNAPKAPDKFNLEFIWKDPSGSMKIDVTEPQEGGKGKNKEMESRITQLKLDFDNAKDKEYWWRSMIKTHISKILLICVLRGIENISEFSDFIKKAIAKQDLYTLELIGKGAEWIPQYIDNPQQIAKNYLNRWLERINRETSKENTVKGMKERHHDINDDMGLKQLNTSVVFDPLSLTEKICSKIKQPIKDANNILIFEKNGSFTYSVINIIGLNNVKKLTIVTFDRMSNEIIHYIVGPNSKLIDIIYIKNINNVNQLDTMGNFDIIIGNPPYASNEGAKNIKLWNKFAKKAIDLAKYYVAMVTPNNVISSKGENGKDLRKYIKDNRYGFIEAQNHEIDYFKGFGVSTCHWIIKRNSPDLVNPIVIDNKPKLTEFENSIINKVINSPDERLNLQMQNGHLKRDDLAPNGKYEIYFSGNKLEKTSVSITQDNKLKVVFPFSSSYHKMFYTTKALGMLNLYIYVDSEKEAKRIIEYAMHPLFRYVAKRYNKTSGFTPFVRSSKIPDLRFKKDWTKDEIYKHFGITNKADIKKIEDDSK